MFNSKKSISLLLVFLMFVSVVGYFLYNFKIETRCTADNCSDKSEQETNIVYRSNLNKEECLNRNGRPLFKAGGAPIPGADYYVGCSLF